ncbi:MAG: hypothetical protein JWM95_1085 [Gemmatimonadetes bacterium]|nr:hypothetical protein [Gemmatimonadota bacterium]
MAKCGEARNVMGGCCTNGDLRHGSNFASRQPARHIVRVLTLIGILIVVAGFAARMNPLLVVTVAGLATGLASGLGPVAVISAFGKAFTESRYVAIVWLVLPVIGLLERAGLKERARTVIAGIPAATTGRVLMIYFTVRQITAALGLTSLGGQAQMVRPLVAPMAEGAAENRFGALPIETRRRIRAHSAAVDNIAVFFGEDIFIAVGSILLIKGFLEQNGIHVEPAQLAIWAVPTAIAAWIIHIVRLIILDRSLARELTSKEKDA